MSGARFVITHHAAERYVERIEPSLSFSEAKGALERRCPDAARLKGRTLLGHEQWKLGKPHPCVLVVKRDSGATRPIVVTVLDVPAEGLDGEWIQEVIRASIDDRKARMTPAQQKTLPQTGQALLQSVAAQAADRVRTLLDERLVEIERWADGLAANVDAKKAEALLAAEEEKTRRIRETLEQQAAFARLKHERITSADRARSELFIEALSIALEALRGRAGAEDALARIGALEGDVFRHVDGYDAKKKREGL